MKKVAAISFLFIFLFSCNNSHPGFVEKEDGVYLKLVSFEDDEKSFKEQYYVEADIIILSGESVIYKRYKEEVISPKKKDFNFILRYLNEGDSAQFKVATQKLIQELTTISLNKIKTEEVEIRIKVNRFISQKEFEEHVIPDEEMLEQVLLKKYLSENNIDIQDQRKGMYIQQLKEGKGKKIKKGDIISVKYKGYFINRIEFDNNYLEDAFTYTYGTPGQVIKGLEIAINGMKKGEKSKIIITSQLAFGEEGSSTQIVPAFTTVIYELEIVNVK